MERQEKLIIQEKFNTLYFSYDNKLDYYSINNKLIINPQAIWDIISLLEYSKSEIQNQILDYLIQLAVRGVNNAVSLVKKTDWVMPNEQSKNLVESLFELIVNQMDKNNS